MVGKEVPAELGMESYSCPHCGALAHQVWFRVVAEEVEANQVPIVITRKMLDEFFKNLESPERTKGKWPSFRDRFHKNEVTFEVQEYGTQSNWRMVNVYLSRCHSCKAFAVWIKDRLAWPAYTVKIEPHPDIPADIRDDFLEAADIVEKSPRGSAALSRLIVQKLMSHIGGQGIDVNANIASLVKKGLEPEIQKALDIVRVTGNNAVHPGEIILKEDPGTAIALLQLINVVVERQIATQKRISEMFDNLPPGALEQIQKRDGSEPQGA